MAIMAVGIIGVVQLLPVGLRASKSAEMMSKAAFLAQEKMEELKLAGFEELSAPNPSVPLEGEKEDYTWTAEILEVSLGGVISSEDIRSLNLTVSWEEKGKPRSQSFVTYIKE
jgi:Tfp pilus assembly protein PilV